MAEVERQRLTHKRWLILAVSCLINLCIGSSYAWSVFSTPMAEYLSGILSRPLGASDLAIVFTVASAITPVTLIAGGFINDRLGAKWVVFGGGVLFGTGMMLSGFAKAPNSLILSYGCGCGLAMGLIYGCTVSNAVKFFPDKRGLIGGIVTASYGISSVLVPPAANILIQKSGVLQAFRTLGIIFVLIICAGAFFMEQCPQDFRPAGYEPAQEGVKSILNADRNWKQMLADPTFYVMILMLTCGAVFGLMTISQVSPIAQNMIGLSITQATASVSVLALFNAAGRVAAGYLSDLIGRVRMLLIMLVSAVGGLLLLYFSGTGDTIRFYAGIAIIGLCFGAFMGVFPSFTADQFGIRNNSVNYGIMFIGFALAGYLGPTLMSSLYRQTGSYQPAFITAIGIAVFGIVLNIILQKMSRASIRSGSSWNESKVQYIHSVSEPE